MAVTAGEYPPVVADVVLGDEYPPTPRRMAGPAGSPVRELRVVYPKPRHKPAFWMPLASVAGRAPAPWVARLAAIDIGWLWLYILVYLPTLFLARRVLKVA